LLAGKEVVSQVRTSGGERKEEIKLKTITPQSMPPIKTNPLPIQTPIHSSQHGLQQHIRTQSLPILPSHGTVSTISLPAPISANPSSNSRNASAAPRSSPTWKN